MHTIFPKRNGAKAEQKGNVAANNTNNIRVTATNNVKSNTQNSTTANKPKGSISERWRNTREKQSKPQTDSKPQIPPRQKAPNKLRKSRLEPFSGREKGSRDTLRDERRKSRIVQVKAEERPLPPRPRPLISERPGFLGASKTTKNMSDGKKEYRRSKQFGFVGAHRKPGDDRRGEIQRALPNLPIRQPPPDSETIAKLIVQSVEKSIKDSPGSIVTVKSFWNMEDEESEMELFEEVAKHTITIGNDTFEVIDHSPNTFHMLREMLSLQDNSYLKSFTEDKLDGLRGAGKSGSFFYQTKDRKFIIKSINEEEHKCLIDITQDYFIVIINIINK